MKFLMYFGSFSLITAVLAMATLDAEAQVPKKIINSGNAKAVGGNGGNAKGPGAVGGNGGGAVAVGGALNPNKGGSVVNSGNANAKGGNGGNANGKGAKGGNGGGAVAVGGDVGGGVANAGNANAKGGNGGNANGKGAKGGNGGDAIAVSGNGNTIVNGNGNTVIGKVVNNNISLNIGGGGFGPGGGFGGGGFGGDGALGVAVATTPAETVIRTDGAPAIAETQDGKDNTEQGEVEQIFTRRFLRVKNESNEQIKVFVQFRGLEDKKWLWTPVDPSESQDAVTFELKPGQEMDLVHKGQKIAASRVRVWGVGEKSNWLNYRDQDLWVVPEIDQRGEHRYLATDMRTFTFVFPQLAESK